MTKPAADTLATVLADELQATEFVRSCVLPSVYVPVAVSCRGTPAATDGLPGVIAIETSVAGFPVPVSVTN
jgi:hypothetical protein